MENIITKLTKKIQYQESDFLGTYALPKLFSDLSDIATNNAYEIGLWNEETAHKYGWVLAKQTMKFSQPINSNQLVTLSTRAKKGSRVQFIRTYDITINDEVIGGGYSAWTLIDIVNRTIVRPDKVGINMPTIIPYESYCEKYENIRKDIKMEYKNDRVVRYSDIDINQHMNNSRYIEWALDLFDLDTLKKDFISEFSVHYLKEMAYGSLVKLYYGQDENYVKIEFRSEDEEITYFEMGIVFSSR